MCNSKGKFSKSEQFLNFSLRKKSSSNPNKGTARSVSKSVPKSSAIPASPTVQKEVPPVEIEKKKEEKPENQKKELAEKKLDRTQDDGKEYKEAESALGVVIKEDKAPAKMDDGYEDFGPGVN